MIVLPDRDDALRIAAFLDEHDGWSAFWDRRYGVWRVCEDDPDSELYAEDADAGRVIGYMSATAGGVYDETAAHAERGANAAGAAAEIDPRLIAFMLPAIPESVRIARFHVRAGSATANWAASTTMPRSSHLNWSPTRSSTPAAMSRKRSG